MKRLIILISFFFVILSLLTHNIASAVGGDVAEYLNNPLRILRGQLPYRDFWLLFPPGEVYFPSLIYKIFGLNINSVLIANIFIRSLSAGIGFMIIKRLTRINLYAFVSAILIYLFAIDNVYVTLVLVSAFFLIEYLRESKNSLLMFSGLTLGLAFWFRFYEIAAVTVAFSVALIYHRNLVSFLKFVLFVSLPVVLLLLVFSPILPQMFDQVIFSSLQHGTVWHLPYFIELKLNLSFLISNFSLSSLLDTPALIGLYLLPFISVFAGVSQLITNKKLNRLEKTTVLLFIVWTICLFPRALRRGAVSDLAHPLLPVFLLSGYLISLPLPKLQKNVFFVLLSLALWSTVNFTIKNTRFLMRERYPIESPYGTLQTTDIVEKIRNQQLIDKLLRSDKPLFYTDWGSIPLYALTDRNNPTYYDSLIDLLAVPDPAKEANICSSLSGTVAEVFHNPEGGVTDVDRHFYSYSSLTPDLDLCLESTDSP